MMTSEKPTSTQQPAKEEQTSNKQPAKEEQTSTQQPTKEKQTSAKQPAKKKQMAFSAGFLKDQIKEPDARNPSINRYGFEPKDLERVMTLHLIDNKNWARFLDSTIERERQSSGRAGAAIKYSNYGAAAGLTILPIINLIASPQLSDGSPTTTVNTTITNTTSNTTSLSTSDQGQTDKQTILQQTTSSIQLIVGLIIIIIKYICEPIQQESAEAEKRLVALKQWGEDHPGWQNYIDPEASTIDVVTDKDCPSSVPASVPTAIKGIHIFAEKGVNKKAFIEHDVPGDGDCGFSVLNIKRADAVSKLRAIKDSGQRKQIMDELIEAVQHFRTSGVKTDDVTRFMSQESRAQINHEINNLLGLHKKITDACNALRTAIHADSIALPNGFTDEAILDYVKEKSPLLDKIPQESKAALLTAANNHQNALDDIERNPDFFSAYIDSYAGEERIWLGTKTMMVLAELQGKALTIWGIDGTTGNLRKLASTQNPPAGSKMSHVLLKNNHYSILKECSMPKMLLTSPTKASPVKQPAASPAKSPAAKPSSTRIPINSRASHFQPPRTTTQPKPQSTPAKRTVPSGKK